MPQASSTETRTDQGIISINLGLDEIGVNGEMSVPRPS